MARIVVKNASTTTGLNLLKLRLETKLNPWTSSAKSFKDYFCETEVVPEMERWRLPLLQKYLRIREEQTVLLFFFQGDQHTPSIAADWKRNIYIVYVNFNKCSNKSIIITVFAKLSPVYFLKFLNYTTRTDTGNPTVILYQRFIPYLFQK